MTKSPIRSSEQKDGKQKTVHLLIFLSIALITGAVITTVRMRALSAWLYSSDIFSFDTSMQETLRGYTGLEFTFGNILGEHAYLFYFALLPLKLLFRAKMTYVLVTLGPLLHGLSGLVFYLTARSILKSSQALVISLVYLLGFGTLYRALFESFYGFHPDTFSGFLAVAFTSFLIWIDIRKARGGSSKPQQIGFWVTFLLFLSLKEEMAILGAAYFAVAFLMKRNRFHLSALLVSIAVTAADFLLIASFQTPFSRTNKVLFSHNIALFKAIGFDFFTNNPTVYNTPYTTNTIVTLWVSVLLCVLLFLAAVALSKKTSPYVLGLFGIGVLKVIAGVFVSSFSVVGWHIFPGITMLIGAVLAQGFFFEKKFSLKRPKLAMAASAMLLLVSALIFITQDLRFARRTYLLASARLEQIGIYQRELEGLKAFINKERIIAIPPMTAVEWSGFRYTFYPRGISESPWGIADYIVYPVNISEKFTGGFERGLPLEETLTHFATIQEAAHFMLLERTRISAEHAESRQSFFKTADLHFSPFTPP